MSAQRDVESFADFIQYYTMKYVKSRNDGRTMYLIRGPADHDRRGCSVSMYRDGRAAGDMVLNEAQVWKEMEWGLPSIGMTVFNDMELNYLYYRTARNGGRGFGRDRVIAHSFNGWMLGNQGLTTLMPDDLGTAVNAWLALTPRHTSLQEAWTDFNREVPNRLAYALSRVFGVFLSQKEYPLLCYKMYEIGDVLGPNKVRLHAKHAEYRDPIHRILNPAMEIEVL